MTFCDKLKDYQTKTIGEKTIQDLLKTEARNSNLFIRTEGFAVDLTRQRIDQNIFDVFQQEFYDKLSSKIKDFMHGTVINTTEKRQVLHHLLRDNPNAPLCESLLNEVKEAVKVREKIKVFSGNVRSGHVKAFDQKFETIISIGIGGSYLGVECVYEALKVHSRSLLFKDNLTLRFLSNVDPSSAFELAQTVDLTKTLVLIVSKSFTTQETLLNFNLLLEAFKNVYSDKKLAQEEIIRQHFCAISSNIEKCKATGISEDRIFPMWDSVGGRFSVSSAVGGLPLSLALGFQVYEEFLSGMHGIDQMFFTQPDVRLNIPVLLGMLDYYHNHIEGYSVKVIIPYSQPLHRFAAHIQQLEMESNGKRAIIGSNNEVKADVAKFVFGEPGTNAQHSFFQLLHQGRTTPVEFIGFCNPQNERKVVGNVDTYNEFVVNMFAQMDALALGQDDKDVNRKFTGNRPTFAIMFKNELNAYNLGALIAIYEHRVATEGFLESINSFDQFGVELGKKLVNEIKGQLKSKAQMNPKSGTRPSHQLIEFYNENTKIEE